MVLTGFATIGAQATNTRIKLSTDAHVYDVGVPVTFTVENNGDSFGCHHWKVTIWNVVTGEYVYYKDEDPDGPWTYYYMPVGNGAIFTWTWDQKYFIVTYQLTFPDPIIHERDPDGKIVLPEEPENYMRQEPTWEPVYSELNGGQVPEGVYKARAEFCNPSGVVASSNIVTFIIGNPGSSHIPDDRGTANNPIL